MGKKEVKITPSILTADFSKLGEEIKKASNADRIHLDVMDGHFVPNLTFGPVVVKAIRKTTKKKFDTHLMIDKPEKYIKEFAEAGSDVIIFHPVATKKPREVIKLIKKYGKKPGVCINPDKPLSVIKPYLKDVDMVLVMSVYAGFGGQKFIPSVLKKIKELRKIFKKDIGIDGGIDDKTIKLAVKAGANIIIAGSYVYDGDPKKRIDILKKNAKSVLSSR